MKGKTPPQQTGKVTSPSDRPKRARRSRKPAEAEVKAAPSKQNQELPKRILTALVSLQYHQKKPTEGHIDLGKLQLTYVLLDRKNAIYKRLIHAGTESVSWIHVARTLDQSMPKSQEYIVD